MDGATLLYFLNLQCFTRYCTLGRSIVFLVIRLPYLLFLSIRIWVVSITTIIPSCCACPFVSLCFVVVNPRIVIQIALIKNVTFFISVLNDSSGGKLRPWLSYLIVITPHVMPMSHIRKSLFLPRNFIG